MERRSDEGGEGEEVGGLRKAHVCICEVGRQSITCSTENGSKQNSNVPNTKLYIEYETPLHCAINSTIPPLT